MLLLKLWTTIWAGRSIATSRNGVIVMDKTRDLSAVADYPFQPVPFTDVKVEDEFWAPRIEANRSVTIPYVFAARADRVLC
jgi:hypothetical protein